MNNIAHPLLNTTQHIHWYWLSAALLGVLAWLSLSSGAVGWDWKMPILWLLPESMTSDVQPLHISVVTQIRLPRLVLAILIGAVLASSGAATQALCRNPLADPSLMGITGGAAMAAVAIIALSAKVSFIHEAMVTPAAFIGAISVTALIHKVASHQGQVQITTLLLAGVAINAMAMAVIGLFSFFADDSALRLMTYWQMGSLGGASWSAMQYGAPLIIVSIGALFVRRKKINALMLGELEARHLGINVKKLKTEIVIIVALGVGGAVALAGMIGFVGLLVPHVARLLVGPDLRRMLPLSMLLGCVLMLIADWISRLVVAPSELPIGIVTALFGSPFFVYQLLKQKRGQHA
ncbi:Hemin transport system permease protein HmuU [Pseudoalteromonas holothuriae]|uniref:Hemin transport system permease protein HmuU n=1 Tax=Pseudoalteromonas holothuriae TaxID=2963714 RepID=A0ABM9GND7_9GAMM|nr:iron ABC transporter permease [Pseudoalteromonas sp. CIP111951]CAH9068022.1 Hemin transport system permease protein HmuU [Pseudoalteromonas sp. CIP111951]